MGVNWTCPHCDRDQTVSDQKLKSSQHHIYIEDLAERSVGYTVIAVGCSNQKCRKLTLHLRVGPDEYKGNEWRLTGEPLFNQRILPRGQSKPQPDYIPAAIREDYQEACLVKDDSPKASATLARRCLQGMIRDFCQIKGARLVDEIKALRKAVEEGNAPQGVTLDSVEAIDHVRGIGNIGAHMEKDINIIVDVDPDEAQILIELIETLFEEWYITRHKRQARLAAIAAIAADKKKQIADGRAGSKMLPPIEDTAPDGAQTGEQK